MQVRALPERDLGEADHIFRLAFGTFLDMPDPTTFAGDSDYVHTRWRAAAQNKESGAAFGAYDGETLIGSNFLTRWGGFGFFGPLTIRPDHWNTGVAQKLLQTTMAQFETWGVRELGLFTFAQSVKHVGLYQKFGFWPQRLTALMGKPVAPRPAAPSLADWEAQLDACRALTDAILPGLDLTSEICALKNQGLGEIVFVEDRAGLAGFALVHCGAGSEAGSDAAYVKFAAVRPGANDVLIRLLRAVEAAAHARGLSQLMAGVNTARGEACRIMLNQGFRTVMHGVAMQKDDRPGFNRPDCLVLDDWR
jgi:GNAT superfamily N-acetyltransferase